MTVVFPPAFPTFSSEFGTMPDQTSHLIRRWMCWILPLAFSGCCSVHHLLRWSHPFNPISSLIKCKNVFSDTFLSRFFNGHPHAGAEQGWSCLGWSVLTYSAMTRTPLFLRLRSQTEKVPALAALLNPLTFLLSSQTALWGGLPAELNAALCNSPRINVLRCCCWKTSGCGWFLTINLPVSATTAPWQVCLHPCLSIRTVHQCGWALCVCYCDSRVLLQWLHAFLHLPPFFQCCCCCQHAGHRCWSSYFRIC